MRKGFIQKIAGGNSDEEVDEAEHASDGSHESVAGVVLGSFEAEGIVDHEGEPDFRVELA